MNREVPDVHTAEPIPDAARSEIERLLRTGDLFRYTASENAPVALLETEFAALMGTRYALAVSSCSAALFLSLKALGLKDRARVLIPAFTFAAVPSAIVNADCVPILAECEEAYRIDLEDFAQKLPQADAVLVSHMRGHTSDMDAIMQLCDAADIPVIEDAAHSLGTLWSGRKIGTIGRIGCFSFQSYKLVNAGEGGILVTDDADLVARAIIMSGAYEHMWKKHMQDTALTEALTRWQNRLPLYNLRLSNLSAAIIRPQLAEIPRRVRDGLRNHDHVATRLSAELGFHVPPPLPQEQRAPDSLQFNLAGLTTSEQEIFSKTAAENGVKVQIFGQSTDNARAFWNWQFLDDIPDLPKTRAMLKQACDVRLPARLTLEDCDAIADILIDAMRTATGRNQRHVA